MNPPRRSSMPHPAGLFRFCVGVAVTAMLAGCVTKAKARAQARAAFVAGQQQALRMQQNPQTQSAAVRIVGPVANPVIPWTQDLTLVKALIAADYQGTTDPSNVIVIRNGLATRLEMRSVFNGRDIPLEAGDIIKLETSPNPAPTQEPQQPSETDPPSPSPSP